jgi:Uroporphyrinogen-III synthase
MQSYKILSTKVLPPELIKKSADHIEISEIEMIQVNPIDTLDKHNEIRHWLTKDLPFIFTSANSVEIINQVLKQEHIEWTDRIIYSVSGKTFDLLKYYFPKHTINTAKNASQLAEKIVSDKVKEIVFFCGDIRRDELPVALHKNNVRLHEVVVYQTIESPTKIEADYDGILFFSPSAVRSFFAANKLMERTVCFAIGATTANSISEYTQNKIIQSTDPDPSSMIQDVAVFFKTRLEHGIKE